MRAAWIKSILRTSDRPGFALAITIAVLGAVPFLAWLQYRWIGEVSTAERERLKASLTVSMSRFVQEFDGEVLQAVESMMQEEALSSESRRIVKTIFLAQGDQLLCETSDAAEHQPCPWPAELNTLRDQMTNRMRAGRTPGLPMFATLIDDSLPALAIPKSPFRDGRPGPPPEVAPFPPAFGQWVILVLNRSYIQDDLLPRLTERYLSHGFRVEVVRRGNPRETIYNSHPTETRGTHFDATAALMEGKEALNARRMRPFAGRKGLGPPPLLMSAMMQGPWLLRVAHSSGSLEAVVDQARVRNLAISAIVLLSLAVSLALLLAATRRAQRLARQQMEFVAGISHELRTPVTVICSAADNLADGVVTNPEQTKRYGAVIRQEGRRLGEMIEETLGFASIESGKRQFDRAPVRVADVMESAVAMCAAELAASGCKLECALPMEVPAVDGDATALTQCLRNLISNAAKHAGSGGRIRLAVAARGSRVEIVVEDFGAGIPAEDLPHIFDPFYRGRRAIADQVHGTGLGLSIVKRIVEAHRGSVTVESTVGKGTRFTLVLPIGELQHA